MTRYDMKTRMLAACLSALAGYVDAIGFLGTGGFFVSFMSGNSTRLGVGVADSLRFALTAGALVAAFVLGVMAASFVGRGAGPRRQEGVMLFVAVCLVAAAGLAHVVPPLATFALVAFAMGAENMLFEAEGEVRIGLTYMTGTLVKIGQRLATAVTGGNKWGWIPFLNLWLGLIIGGVAGALAYMRMGLDGLWIAAGAASLLALVIRRLAADREPRPA